MADAAAAATASAGTETRGQPATGDEQEEHLLIRHMRPDELKQAMDIWKERGLKASENSVSTFYQVDPEGFFVTVDTRTGRVVATCACVRQHESLFFVGLYAVRKHLEGRGIGTRLWRTMARRLGDCNAGLNTMPKHLSTYQNRAGFGHLDTWNTLVYTGTAVSTDKLARPTDELGAVPVSAKLLPQVIAYDALVHCYNREKAVTYTVYDTDGFARAVVRRRPDGSEVVCGFGKIGTNILGGAMMGPVYAEDRQAADVLLRALVDGNPLTRVGLVMMVVDCNPDGIALAEDLGLESKRRVPRCYRRAIVPARFDHIFAQHDVNFSAF
ncbi:uncharacterized protein LOC119444022 isoform X1 [Dermacentor silvarum]|uniref:uncharacterized protein LOC119444022 isoform X1 n=1 Tax=Dermacentor silvarum TaxID=543639 RepID=UPI00189BAB89|nr:uncharacterized protein LOC119444022 isoform X1 [Dermacentor silvarum]